MFLNIARFRALRFYREIILSSKWHPLTLQSDCLAWRQAAYRQPHFDLSRITLNDFQFNILAVAISFPVIVSKQTDGKSFSAH